MAKLKDNFYNRVIEGELKLNASEQAEQDASAIKAVEGASSGTLSLALGLDSNGKIKKGNVLPLIAGQDIAPKDISASGSITGEEIIENMTGYSFAPAELENWVKEYIYVNVVKTGNKLTFVLAMNLTRTADTGSLFPSIGVFTIPNSIYNKLYPTQIGDYSWLDVKTINVFSSENASVSLPIRMSKGASNSLGIQITATNFVVNTKYYIRYEATFLLGENLIGE